MIKYILLLSSFLLTSSEPVCPETCTDAYKFGEKSAFICSKEPQCKLNCDWCAPYRCEETCGLKASPCKFDQCATCEFCLNRTPVIDLGSIFHHLIKTVAEPISECTERTQTFYNKCMRRTKHDEEMCNEYSDDFEETCMECHGSDIDKCINDKPKENCNHQSIRILKKCMKSGGSDKKCNALSSRIFFDCYQM